MRILWNQVKLKNWKSFYHLNPYMPVSFLSKLNNKLGANQEI